MYVEKRVVRIHFTREHTAKFQIRGARFYGFQVLDDGVDGFFVIFFSGQFEQFRGVLQGLVEFGEGVDNAFELAAFTPKRLRPLRIFPDCRLLEFA